MKNKKIRYAVVGQGHISQVAILPGFKAARNAELVALVSGDAGKLKALSKRYHVPKTYSYEEYEQCLRSGDIDAVYIALPNHMHREYATRAAEAGIHVLCEKPIAVTTQDSEAIVQSAKKNDIKLMIAYRLHFDPANLKAIDIVNSGKIGEPRYFVSQFGYELKTGNIRMQAGESGGPIHDIGIYCINAVRYLFKEEPNEVFAYGATPDRKYHSIYETVCAVMKFASGKLATFTVSFGSGAISNFRVVGQHGDLFVDNAYEYVGEMTHTLTVGEKQRVWTTKPGDQFAAELRYFSECILKDREPEPAGLEGVTDVKIVEALYRSLKTGKPVSLRSSRIRRRPTLLQAIKAPAHREPRLLKVSAASK